MVTFNDVKIADVGYYINLDSRVDRKDNIESQFNKFNIKGVNRFSAFSSYSSNPSNCKKVIINYLNCFYTQITILC